MLIFIICKVPQLTGTIYYRLHIFQQIQNPCFTIACNYYITISFAFEFLFHTYSAYARGIDILNNTYNYLDLVPKGRDEDDYEFPMAWVRRHDEYNKQLFTADSKLAIANNFQRRGLESRHQ